MTTTQRKYNKVHFDSIDEALEEIGGILDKIDAHRPSDEWIHRRLEGIRSQLVEIEKGIADIMSNLAKQNSAMDQMEHIVSALWQHDTSISADIHYTLIDEVRKSVKSYQGVKHGK